MLEHIESEISILDITIINELNGCSKIFTDQNRVRVILLCLLSNAVLYQDIDNKQKGIVIKGVCDEERLELEIADNGIGISKEKLDSVFEMFVKLNNISNGPGLGLYIAREILKKLSGSIYLTSNVQQGTVVTVIIPIC